MEISVPFALLLVFQKSEQVKGDNLVENVFDFLRAALPWIVMGLLLAVFAARSAGRKKKEKEIDNYGIEGMCLGMCFGMAVQYSPESMNKGK